MFVGSGMSMGSRLWVFLLNRFDALAQEGFSALGS